MKDIYLVKYSVKGVKTLDKLISLNFYKETISKKMNTQKYNIKGIYGMNGSGKSGIVSSVEILRNLLVDANYLNNPVVQKNLDAIINKKMEELFIECDYVVDINGRLHYFEYSLVLSKDITDKYVISHEKLLTKDVRGDEKEKYLIFEVEMGEISYLCEKNEFSKLIFDKTTNLLSTTSICALFYEKILIRQFQIQENKKDFLYFSLMALWLFGIKLYVYLDESDNHRAYITRKSVSYYPNDKIIDYLENGNIHIDVITAVENIVPKEMYSKFERNVGKLYEFLHIFKPDLKSIEIDRKENANLWLCDLIMNYEDYKIHAEYESTGIKKLVQLFAYLKKMVQGGIVFIDEFDSNLHDVYLCALLEYLMEYGEGQLCFTTHNIGPMDVLKRHERSIDFLSEDHTIYSWKKGIRYSPSNLYRNGMIEGSPFNVGSMDFIGVFNEEEENI